MGETACATTANRQFATLVGQAFSLPVLLPRAALPEVVSAIAPRRVILAGALDAAGKKLKPELAQKLHEGATNLEVRSQTGWTMENLKSLV